LESKHSAIDQRDVKSRGVIAAAESLSTGRHDFDTVLSSVLSHLTASVMKRGFITI
jgi:hypothetical protein